MYEKMSSESIDFDNMDNYPFHNRQRQFLNKNPISQIKQVTDIPTVAEPVEAAFLIEETPPSTSSGS